VATAGGQAGQQTVQYRLGSQTVNGHVWMATGARLLVDQDGTNDVHAIDEADVIQPTTTPTDTTPTDTTPDNPPPVSGSRPFSDNSPFNTPVGTNPTVLSNSASLVSAALRGGQPLALSTDRAVSNDWGHPVYYTKASDPMATLVMSSTHQTFHANVPNYAIPAGQADAHICIVAPDGWEYNLWATKRTGSPGNYTFTAQIGGRMPANGPGIKTPAQASQYGPAIDGGVEAKFSERAGLITASDMQAGVINHALFVVVKGATAGDNGVVYPAYSANGGYKSPTSVRMGQRFWLDMTPAQIDATDAPQWEKIVAKAAATYGIYVGDKGGDGFGMMMEDSTPYIAANTTNPWDSYMQSIGVRNSGSYGYVLRFSGDIPWPSALRAVAPPSPQIP
jgi:hypothetical protein